MTTPEYMAYSTGRSEIISWMNKALGIRLGSLEDLPAANGSAAAQLVHVLHQDAVPLGKVNFAARNAYERERNYKLIQVALEKVGVKKRVDVQKLVEGKPMALLEFAQWMKWYWDSTNGSNALQVYGDPETRRTEAGAKVSCGSFNGKDDKTKTRNQKARPQTTKTTTTTTSFAGGEARRFVGNVHALNDSLKKELAQAKVVANSLEKERDFYFAKLRDCEITCDKWEERQDSLSEETQKLIKAIQTILCSADTSPINASKTPRRMKENVNPPTTIGKVLATPAGKNISPLILVTSP